MIPIHYYVFDVMVLSGVDIMRERLFHRLELLEPNVLPKLNKAIRYASELEADVPGLILAAQNVLGRGDPKPFLIEEFLRNQCQRLDLIKLS